MSEADCFLPPWPALIFGQWGVAARSAHSWIRHCYWPKGSDDVHVWLESNAMTSYSTFQGCNSANLSEYGVLINLRQVHSGGSRICQRGGVGAKPPWSWKLFVHFYTKKWPKVKDLSENLPPCLSRAAKASPKFWSMGGGAAALTVHSWIRHWKFRMLLQDQQAYILKQLDSLPAHRRIQYSF